MSNELRRRINAIASEKPIGTLTTSGGRLMKDEAGRLFTYKSVEQAERERKIKLRKQSDQPFFWSVMTNVSYVSSVLTPTQRGYLFVLTTYLAYDGRLLAGNKPLSTAKMRDVLNAKKSTFYEFLDACKAYGIITEQDGVYRISNGFHYRGKMRDNNVTRTAIKQLREMAGYLSAKDIGLLYSLIPFIHVDTNVVAENPDERDIEKVRPMNRNKIAEAIGIDRATFHRCLGRMRFRGGSPMFARFDTADAKGLFVNPLLMARNIEAIDASMRVVFRLKDDELR